MLAITTDMSKTASAEVVPLSALSLTTPLLPGTSRTTAIRIVNDGSTERVVSVIGGGEENQRIRFSRVQYSGYLSALSGVVVRADGCSDTLWLKIATENNATTTTEVDSSIVITDDNATVSTISVNYACISAWSSIANPYDFYSDVTRRSEESIRTKGAVIDLAVWHPQTDKTTLEENPVDLSELNRKRVSEWVNPYGEFWTKTDLPKVKAFIGGKNISTPFPRRYGDAELFFEESFRVVVEPSCVFPSRQYVKWGAVNGVQDLYQRSFFSISREHKLYALDNLMPSFTPNGEFIYWVGVLRLIFAPTTMNPNGYLPWNCLFPLNSDSMGSYAQTFLENYEDPYLGA